MRPLTEPAGYVIIALPALAWLALGLFFCWAWWHDGEGMLGRRRDLVVSLAVTLPTGALLVAGSILWPWLAIALALAFALLLTAGLVGSVWYR
jgi:hypothetical protein